MRVDFGSPGPTDVGGAWPGQHVEGTTYVRHVVTPAENLRIAFHSGTYNGSFQAGMNGFRVRKLGAIPVGARVAAGVYFVRLVDTDAPEAPGGQKLVRIE